MKNIFLVLLLVTIHSFSTFGQKKHYKIKCEDESIVLTHYIEAAEAFKNIDQYRFLDERREITFINSKVVLELYSAKELLNLYGKKIDSDVIVDPSSAQPISFKLGVDGVGRMVVIDPKK